MTAKKSSVVITAMGALTPLGEGVEATCAAIEAGISRVTEHAYYQCTPDDPEWDEDLPLFSASVPTIDPFTDGLDRFMELSMPSLTEVMEKSNLKRTDLAKTSFYLSLPQQDEATFNLGLAANLLPTLCKQTGLTSFQNTKINQSGHTGVFAHISEAIDLLESGSSEFCIVGGVDSYLLNNRLAFLDSTWRIRSDRNVDGFIPGEASIMLMLETESHAKARGAKILAKITSIAEGLEPDVISSEKTSSGSGLTQAIRGILDNSSNTSFESVYCSLNGESYYAFEWGIQLTRLNTAFNKLTSLEHPAEYVGDIGAATGGLLIASATNALQTGLNESNKALLWSSSDTEQRMALCLEQA